MDIIKIINNLKIEGFVNAGQLVFNNDEIEELSSLCRNTFKRLSEQNSDSELHKDFIDVSAGAEGFSRVPEHDSRLLELLDKLVNDPNIVKDAKKELIERRGPKFNYYSMLGDREPPLDYRK